MRGSEPFYQMYALVTGVKWAPKPDGYVGRHRPRRSPADVMARARRAERIRKLRRVVVLGG